jgi:cytochrome c553
LTYRLHGKFFAALLVMSGPAGAALAQDMGDKLELCMSCHGETGQPQMQGVPALAGRPVQELSDQLKLFRDGRRQNPQMVMARRLADEEIEALAGFFAKQRP